MDPRQVLEAFGVADARHYVERQSILYFVACGVRVEGSSDDGLQRPRLDDRRRAQPLAELSLSERSEDSAVNRALRARIRRQLEAVKQEAARLPRPNDD